MEKQILNIFLGKIQFCARHFHLRLIFLFKSIRILRFLFIQAQTIEGISDQKLFKAITSLS